MQLSVILSFFADDTRLYFSCSIDVISEVGTYIEDVREAIRLWMACNFLWLNDGETEYVLIGSKGSLSKRMIYFIVN